MSNIYPSEERISGLKILASIMEHCDARTNNNIISGLATELPQIASKLKSMLLSFDDLRYANPQGIKLLLKQISFRDLAAALRGSDERLLPVLAKHMSRNNLQDLREKITLSNNISLADVQEAREKILCEMSALIKENRMYIDKKWAE
ncbi:MAG: hypothetical protein GX221_06540 [Candidatus Riflebacteria bacterium]|nr:hypothetical protein [Candidatus Riflebacteria bacterium]